MKKTFQSLAGIAIAALSSCATPYQSDGFRGGYTETRLGPDMTRITFAGNGYTRRERAQDFALLRAAEIGLQNGYPYFVVINESNDTSSSTHTTAGYSYTSGSSYGIGGGVNYSGTTTYVPGRTFNVNKPESGLLVKFLKKKLEGMAVFDAAFLSQSLKEKYKIKQAP